MLANSYDNDSRRVLRFLKDTTADIYEVDNVKIVEITYHYPLGEGDRHYCDVYYKNGKVERVFNIDRIDFDVLQKEPNP